MERTNDVRRAIVLLGPGGHNLRANRRLRTIAGDLAARPEMPAVVAAYVHAGAYGASPSLGEAVEALVAGGVAEVAIVPCLLEWSYPEHFDVPDLLRDLCEQYPGVPMRLGRVLGADPEIVKLLARGAEEVWQLPDAGSASIREVAELAEQAPVTTATLRAGAAPNLPPQEQHLLLCTGRRCAEVGSADVYRRLAACLAERGLDGGPHRVKVTRTKCLGPCAAAPVLCLYPAGAYFVGLGSDAIPAFVDKVLVAGGTLEGHTFRPER